MSANGCSHPMFGLQSLTVCHPATHGSPSAIALWHVYESAKQGLLHESFGESLRLYQVHSPYNV